MINNKKNQVKQGTCQAPFLVPPKTEVFRGKRGDETMAMIIVSIAIILIITASVMIFMSDKASGKAIQSEIKAKQAALLIDAAKPGTTIFVDYSVQIEGNEVIFEDARYSFFNNADVTYRNVNGGTEITI